MVKKLNLELPKLPGVYVFKNAEGNPIYIGKAKSLKNRVSSYFHNQKTDWKVAALIEEHASLEYILTKNEIEALLLETQMIQQYKPKFNVLMTSGQPFVYILFTEPKKTRRHSAQLHSSTTQNEQEPIFIPEIKIVRNKREKGTYFGPFLYKSQARRVHQYLVEKFRLMMCNKKIENGCLEYHIGLCPGNCKLDFNPQDYIFRMELAKEVLHKNHKDFIKKLETKIKEYSANMDFEKARSLHQYIENFEVIFETIRTHFHEEKYATDIVAATLPSFSSPLKDKDQIAQSTMPRAYQARSADELAERLQKFFNLNAPVHTIDCFDISHFQSRSIVGSCIRFRNGKPDKDKFRRFQVRTLERQNDYAALQEIVSRRYRNPEDIPDLILIDGGKGQLSAARAVLPPDAHIISLAKREETVFGLNYSDGKILDIKTDIGKLLIALRDYAHHFAISYHRLKRNKLD